jgi:hypothetical protein
MSRRRRFLLSLAAAATVAGCTDASTGSNPDSTDDDGDSDTATAEPTPTPAEELEVGEDGGYTVDVSGTSDGSVTVSDTAIEFTAPIEMTWRLQGFNDGYRVTADEAATASTATPEGPPLEVGPALDPTDDAQHAFATPIYDADADRLEFWFYVDETYRETHPEHHVIWGEAATVDVISREAEFSERADGIYRATATYDLPVSEDMAFPLGVLLDRPFSEATPQSGTRPEYSGVGVTPQIQTGPRTPQVAFEFDHAESASEVTITHTAGDTVQGSNLQVLVDGDPASTQFSGEVVAGDSITVDVSDAGSEAEIGIIWESPDGNASATLAMFRLP